MTKRVVIRSVLSGREQVSSQVICDMYHSLVEYMAGMNTLKRLKADLITCDMCHSLAEHMAGCGTHTLILQYHNIVS